MTLRGNRRYTRSRSRDLGRLHAQFRLTSSPSTDLDRSAVGSGQSINSGSEPTAELGADGGESPVGNPPTMAESISQTIERRLVRRFWWSRG